MDFIQNKPIRYLHIFFFKGSQFELFLIYLFILLLSLASFLTKTKHLGDTTVKFELWDTGGQERYHSLAPMYYRGAQAVIVVYSITDSTSFDKAKYWVKELRRTCNPHMVIALAGNVDGDPSGQRMVNYEVKIKNHSLFQHK